MAKVRLDILVQQCAGVSRSKAQGLIHTGQVYDGEGRRLDKPGQSFDADTELDVREGPRYVSRGGEKLAAAIAAFQPELEGLVAIDVGASTGGFTDCLLQHGAGKVYAVDVGYGQLAWSLRDDARVVVFERTNIRALMPDRLEELPTFFTVDCSFIGLSIVLEALLPLLSARAEGIVLVKPQFEAGRGEVGKGGVVRSQETRDRVIEKVRASAESLGFSVGAVIPSPLIGPAGNHEYLMQLRRDS